MHGDLIEHGEASKVGQEAPDVGGAPRILECRALNTKVYVQGLGLRFTSSKSLTSSHMFYTIYLLPQC
jgi:hypothetical protein